MRRPPQAGAWAETLAAFDDYMRRTEQELAARLSDPGQPLWGEVSSAFFARIKSGEIPVEALNGGRPVHVPDGLVHDWIGGVFIPLNYRAKRPELVTGPHGLPIHRIAHQLASTIVGDV